MATYADESKYAGDTEAKRAGVLTSELNSLEKNLAILGEMIQVTSNQLGPLMPPQPSQSEMGMTGEAQEDYREGSAIVEQVRGLQRMTKRLTNQIQSVLERIEL